MGTVDNIKAGKPVLLVEIGTEWVKLLQAEPGRRGVSMSRLHIEHFDSLGQDVSRVIANALKTQKFIRGPVVACLPRHLVNVRILELPSVKPEEVTDMLELQVGKQTPYSKDEISFDYRYAGGQREGYSRLMLVIVQRSVLRERFYILEEAGLKVDRMSVGSEGLLNWYAATAGDGRQEAEVLLDVDAGFSDFAVVHNGQMVFTRSILIGASHLAEDLDKWREKLAHEIRQSIEMCRAENGGVDPVRLLVTGAGARIPALAPELGSQVGLAAETVDSTKSAAKWPASPSLEAPEYAGISLTALVGMAMAPEQLEMHLVPDSIKLRQDLVTKTRLITLLGMLVMTLMLTLSFWLISRAYLARERLLLLRGNLRELEPVVQRVAGMLGVVRAVEERRRPDLTAVSQLAELHPLVPAGITLDGIEIHVDEGRLVVGGTASTRQDIRDMINALERSALYKDVKESMASRRGEDGRFKFQVTALTEGGG